MTLHPPAGLCDTCRWQKLVRNTRGSTFSMCRHPELPKYPRLPVAECRGYEAAGDLGPAAGPNSPG